MEGLEARTLRVLRAGADDLCDVLLLEAFNVNSLS